MIYREFHAYNGRIYEIVANDEADMHRMMMDIDRRCGCPDDKNRWIECYKEDMKLKNRIRRSIDIVLGAIHG